MDIQIVGPAAGTGYGVVASHLCWALSQLEDTHVSFIPIGSVDLWWFEDKVRLAVTDAMRLEEAATQKPDFTLCIWHEWDHPPIGRVTPEQLAKMSDKYIAMPTFELDRIRPGAPQSLSNCWRVLVSSKHCLDVLLKAGLTNARMKLFHGVDTEVFKPDPLGKGPRMRLLNIGKMEKRKGHDLCIKALAWCLSEGMELDLWCMWNNPFIRGQEAVMMDGWIRDAASTYGLSIDELRKHIMRIGSRDKPSQVAQVINSCDAGLYPFRAEGWNLPLLETMACGLPVVATYYSGPVEYLTGSGSCLVDGDFADADDGLWFGPGKLEGRWLEPYLTSICRGIHELYIRWQSGQSGNPNGIKVAEEFTWSRAAKRVRSWLASGCELSS